jgi:hypothetical protein
MSLVDQTDRDKISQIVDLPIYQYQYQNTNTIYILDSQGRASGAQISESHALTFETREREERATRVLLKFFRFFLTKNR